MTWKLWTPKIFVWGRILSLSTIFSVQMWQWRILTIKKETLYEKNNIINFYTFVIEIMWTKEPWILCYLVVFFGFHPHYLHSEVTGFPVVLVATQHISFKLIWSHCSFLIYHNGLFSSSLFLVSRNFLACCELFPHLNVTFDRISSTFSFVSHWCEKFLLMVAGNYADLTITQVPNVDLEYRINCGYLNYGFLEFLLQQKYFF